VSFAGWDRRKRSILPAVSAFTGQLDAILDKQFKDYVVLHKGKASLPVLLDLNPYPDYIDSSGLGVLVQLRQLWQRRQPSASGVGKLPASFRPSSW